MGCIESIFLGAFYDGRENCQGRWLMLNATILDLTPNAYKSHRRDARTPTGQGMGWGHVIHHEVNGDHKMVC